MFQGISFLGAARPTSSAYGRLGVVRTLIPVLRHEQLQKLNAYEDGNWQNCAPGVDGTRKTAAENTAAG
eukprot:6176430-Pleurochrysis_carterae.AAC.2